MDLHRPIPLRLAEAEAELVQIEGEKAEAEVKFANLKKRISGFQRFFMFLALPNITIILIPIFVPLMIFFALVQGMPLASARGSTERRIAELTKAISAKRSEIARLKVEAARAS